jgi:hypothetical protein
MDTDEIQPSNLRGTWALEDCLKTMDANQLCS